MRRAGLLKSHDENPVPSGAEARIRARRRSHRVFRRYRELRSCFDLIGSAGGSRRAVTEAGGVRREEQLQIFRLRLAKSGQTPLKMTVLMMFETTMLIVPGCQCFFRQGSRLVKNLAR